MPCVARLDIPGILQHVIVRGIERHNSLLDDQDMLSILERFSFLIEKTGISYTAVRNSLSLSAGNHGEIERVFMGNYGE
jgi:hypothetical protein